MTPRNPGALLALASMAVALAAGSGMSMPALPPARSRRDPSDEYLEGTGYRRSGYYVPRGAYLGDDQKMIDAAITKRARKAAKKAENALRAAIGKA